jgi:alpha-1,3-rhamnosyl/mannosyltransferase
MRVLLNGMATIRLKSGVGHTTTNLHRALSSLSPADRFWLYPGKAIRNLAARWIKPAQPSFVPRKSKGNAAGKLLKTLVNRSLYMGYAAHFYSVSRLSGFDLYHEPNMVSFDLPLPTVVTVHDLSVVLFPEWHPAERVKRYERSFVRSLAKASHVLVVSDAVRNETVNKLGIDPNRVSTIHNAIDTSFRPQSDSELKCIRARFELPERYLLYVGNLEPRKNIITLMRAYCDLPWEIREQCPLVLAGSWGWKSEPIRELFESVARHRGVRHLGYVADQDLPALYGGSTALLYPSFYEGFGLPPLEAMACGSAAIVSTASAIREVVGKQALQIDPNDTSAWREAIRRAIIDRDYLEAYRREGIAYAARFSWDNAALKTLDLYRRVLGISSSSALASPLVRAA